MKRKIAIVLGAVGAIAPAATLGSDVTVVDIALNGAIWCAIGYGIGAIIEKIRGRSAAKPLQKHHLVRSPSRRSENTRREVPPVPAEPRITPWRHGRQLEQGFRGGRGGT